VAAIEARESINGGKPKMTEEHVKILVQSKNGQKMRARKVTLGQGEDFAVYIPNKIGFFCVE
jgi:hypothetical protein